MYIRSTRVPSAVFAPSPDPERSSISTPVIMMGTISSHSPKYSSTTGSIAGRIIKLPSLVSTCLRVYSIIISAMSDMPDTSIHTGNRCEICISKNTE